MTVHLLHSSQNTPPEASFTGSMQLLAGVKLCTDRHITNHPHYENKFLRERTKQVKIIIQHIMNMRQRNAKSLTTDGIAMPEWSWGLPLSVRTLEPAKYEYTPGSGCSNVGWRYPADEY